MILTDQSNINVFVDAFDFEKSLDGNEIIPLIAKDLTTPSPRLVDITGMVAVALSPLLSR